MSEENKNRIIDEKINEKDWGVGKVYLGNGGEKGRGSKSRVELFNDRYGENWHDKYNVRKSK